MKNKMSQGWSFTVRQAGSLAVTMLFVLLAGCAKQSGCGQYAGPSKDLCLLRTNGAAVLRAGEMVKIVLPSDRLFVNDTPEFRRSYQPILGIAANFIRSFSTVSVRVAAFTNPTPGQFRTKGGETLSHAMTKAQAAAVSRYLWRHNVNTRLMYSVGRNGHDPIAWSGSPIGRYLNRRVEITFRYYRDSTAWY